MTLTMTSLNFERVYTGVDQRWCNLFISWVSYMLEASTVEVKITVTDDIPSKVKHGNPTLGCCSHCGCVDLVREIEAEDNRPPLPSMR